MIASQGWHHSHKNLLLAVCALWLSLPSSALGQPTDTQPPPPSPVPDTQPPPREPPATPSPRRLTRLTRLVGNYRTTPSRVRLASVPDMFGDLLLRSGTITATETDVAAGSTAVTIADVPGPGGIRGSLIGEHNKALPVDRIYFNYNHYRSPLEQVTTTTVPPTTVVNTIPVDRYTLGWEQTFRDGCFSIELRMPFYGDPGLSFDVSAVAMNDNVSIGGGLVGNATVIFKKIVYEDCDTVFSAGLGVEVPTGDDATTIIGRTRYEFANEAVHLSPFVAWMQTPNDITFQHAFIQLGVPLNGNTIAFTGLEAGGPTGSFGEYNDQTLLHVNLAGGVWLHRDECAPLLTGVAALAELHYTTTLQDADAVTGTRPVAGPDTATLAYSNRAGNVDVVNLGTGLHLEVRNDTNVRVAGVFPITSSDNRFFDAELSVQVSRRY
ncbi:MAG: hypothetical protein O3C40_03310 [Planctomycetota bacterium]|nr:hypothetical protein [Planctomycetota bacterium]